jgi:hypothetical protein
LQQVEGIAGSDQRNLLGSEGFYRFYRGRMPSRSQRRKQSRHGECQSEQCEQTGFVRELNSRDRKSASSPQTQVQSLLQFPMQATAQNQGEHSAAGSPKCETDDLLLGFLREKDSFAARLLVDPCLDLQNAHRIAEGDEHKRRLV